MSRFVLKKKKHRCVRDVYFELLSRTRSFFFFHTFPIKTVLSDYRRIRARLTTRALGSPLTLHKPHAAADTHLQTYY